MARSSVLSSAVRIEPKEAEQQLTAEVARADRQPTLSLTLQLSDGTTVPLPHALVEVLRASADELADGHAVTVLPSERLPRSQHRRILLSDVLVFQAKRERRRQGRRRIATSMEEADLPY